MWIWIVKGGEVNVAQMDSPFSYFQKQTAFYTIFSNDLKEPPLSHRHLFSFCINDNQAAVLQNDGRQ